MLLPRFKGQIGCNCNIVLSIIGRRLAEKTIWQTHQSDRDKGSGCFCVVFATDNDRWSPNINMCLGIVYSCCSQSTTRVPEVATAYTAYACSASKDGR